MVESLVTCNLFSHLATWSSAQVHFQQVDRQDWESTENVLFVVFGPKRLYQFYQHFLRLQTLEAWMS